MTREVTTDDKNDMNVASRTIATSYSDGTESEDSEASSDGRVDSTSDSDLSAVDKNNNLSPQPLRAFAAHSSARRGHICSSEGDNSHFIYADMSSNKSNHELKGDSTVTHDVFDESACTSQEGNFSDEDELVGFSQGSRSSDDDVFNEECGEEILDDCDGSEPRLRYANANENNNSNRKKFRGIGSNSASYDMQNNNNSWNFRSKMRSVQLSSVRASKGRYQGSEIKPYKGRMIARSGDSNVKVKKFGKLDWVSRYSKDIYTTLIDLSWTWVVFLTSAVYIGHWIIFGLIYWLFAVVYDDYSKIFPDDSVNATNEEPCVSGVYSFSTAFLFSMESETTIGYGYRNMGTSCKAAIVCLIVQCVISAIFDTWVIGMCFSRIARPDARCNTVLYSKNAVICTRDGKKCLIVRVANLRKSLLLGVSCRARVITLRAPQRREANEGHQFMLEQKELEFENANCTMLTAPVEYRHVIDKDSPLYSIPERCFASEKQNWFEIVFILTGCVEATGMTMHAQTSYLSTEIKYKHRFEPVVSISSEKEKYIVDFSKFHDTYQEPPITSRMIASKRGSKPSQFEPLQEESEDTDEPDEVFQRASKSQCHYCDKQKSLCSFHTDANGLDRDLARHAKRVQRA